MCQDWHSKCMLQGVRLEVKGVSLKWRFNLRSYSRKKMSIVAVPYFNNSAAKFRLVIKLFQDVETNPGPDNYSVNKQKNSTYLKIAQVNARSLKNRYHDHHVNKTVSTCLSILGQINRVKHAFDKCTLITIIKSLVFSRLYYCSNIQINTPKCNIEKLQLIPNFACRIVCGVRKFDHVTPALKELK